MSARPQELPGAAFSVDEPGFDFMCYALVRALRPGHVAVIGSPSDRCAACFALALKDNGHGKLNVVDSGFFDRYEERELPGIDLAMIDGDSFGQVRQDFIDVMRHTRRNSYVLLRDAPQTVHAMIGPSGTKRWLRVLQRDRECFEAVALPARVTLVRVLRDGPWHPGV